MSGIDTTILEMISEGARNIEIAERLHYSLASVKVRVRRLMQAYGARNRAELAAKATGSRPCARPRGAYKVGHIGSLTPAEAAVHGALFRVTSVEDEVETLVAV